MTMLVRWFIYSLTKTEHDKRAHHLDSTVFCSFLFQIKMNSHVSKNDTLAGKVVTKVQQVRKFILKHRVSKKKNPGLGGDL